MNLKTAFVSLAASSFWAVEVVVGQGQGATMDSCSAQESCIKFTTKYVMTAAKCGDLSECEYEICAELRFDKASCRKETDDSISHTCVGDNDRCFPNFGSGDFTDRSFFTKKQSEDGAIEALHGGKQCQTVPVGGTAEFYFKDGRKCDGTVSRKFGCVTCGAATTTCRGEGGGTHGMACAWQIKAPDICGGECGGDPYFKAWSGQYYGYHGECDLVLMQNPAFGAGIGLDLHVRTQIEDFYSLISSAALRIGADILELDGEQMYFNSKKVEETNRPAHIAGYPIHYITEQKGKLRVEVSLTNDNDHNILYNMDEKIIFRRKKGFMWINFSAPTEINYRNATGLLGTFETKLLMGRDGATVYKDTSEFAEHWQVMDTDDKLFHDLRAPQYPQKCKMPQTAETKKLRRLQKTISREQAAEACAHWPTRGQESCIFDVMMTGDLEMADDPF